jgi:hypothetical protein
MPYDPGRFCVGEEAAMNRLLAVLFAAAAAAAFVFGCEAMERYGASKPRVEGVHEGARQMTEDRCFACHLEGKNGAPKAPSSMIGRRNCAGCHFPE